MSLVEGLEIFTALAVLASSLAILLAAHGAAGVSSRRIARYGAWGHGLTSAVALTGGLATQEAALVFGGLCMACLALGLEAPTADFA